MSLPQSGFEAYLGFFASLRESGASFFLEGGQAVNFWAEYVVARNHKSPLNSLRPFTSRDCDIWVSHSTWKDLKSRAGGKLLQGTSPADGQLGILTLSQDPPLVVDVMSNVYGISVEEYPRLFDRALDDGEMKVLDPLYLFLSKCHCLLGLDQTGRQDERHVRMLAFILPAYMALLIDAVEEGSIDVRALLKELKLLRSIVAKRPCRHALKQLSISADSIIPWKKLANSSSEKLVKYAETQHPDWE